MKVGILAPNRPLEQGGGSTFEEEVFYSLLKQYRHTSQELVVFSLSDNWTPPLACDDLKIVKLSSIPLHRFCAVISSITNRFFAAGLGLPHLIRAEDWLDPILLKHGIQFFLNLTPWTLTKEIPFLTQVWDLQYRFQPYFPEVSAQGRWVRWEAKYSSTLRRATYVVVPNDASKDQVKNFFGVADERVKILPLPTPSFALEAARNDNIPSPAYLGIKGDYILYPAQFWPHKNHATVLRALSVLRDERNYRPQAVFVGADWGNLGYVRELGAKMNLSEQLHFLGFIPREDLVALYRHAKALVFPSMFGPENLPPLEAFALGCPVVASRISSADQLGDSALLVHDTDEHAYAQAIYALHTQPSLRAELIEKGRKRAMANTGDDFARGILALLDDFEKIRQCWSSDQRYDSRYSWKQLLYG